MRFIRKNGRVIPIKDDSTSSDSQKATAHLKRAQKASLISGAAQGVLSNVSRAAILSRNKPLFALTAATGLGLGLGGQIGQIKVARDIKKESGGKRSAVGTYLDLSTTSWLASGATSFASTPLLSKMIKGSLKSKTATASAMKSVHSFSERVAENRKVRRAKTVKPIYTTSGYFHK